MIYNPNNYIQRIFKKIHMLQNDIVLQVSIEWVTKNIEFDPNLLNY
jgi:hypothetical protein